MHTRLRKLKMRKGCERRCTKIAQCSSNGCLYVDTRWNLRKEMLNNVTRESLAILAKSINN